MTGERMRRPRAEADSLADFTQRTFSAEGTRLTIWEKGSGPGVLVMHEVPGITPEVADFARRIADAGYTVSMPCLFGVPGQPYSHLRSLQQLARACIAREFRVLALRQSSPITHVLRALCRDLHHRCGGPGVGAVGMCLTGNFALALMLEPCMLAPVLSQPSLPFALTPAHARDLHLNDVELSAVKQRAQEGCPVLGLRFRNDPMSPAARFSRLQDELGPAFRAVTLDIGKHARTTPIPHSVLALERREEDPAHPTHEAMNAVLTLFAERLHR